MPPSKSATNRAVLLAWQSGYPVVLEPVLRSDDTERLFAAVEACGARVTDRGAALEVASSSPSSAARIEVDCGASGTLLRFLLGVLAGRLGNWRLDGTARLRQRPVGPLVDALRDLGADVTYCEGTGFAPLEIRGVRLAGSATVDAAESSQFVSALVLAAVAAEERIQIGVENLTSEPYLDLTIEMVGQFGGSVLREDDRLTVTPGLEPPGVASIEGDWSSAAYVASAAVLTGGEVDLAGLDPTSSQGDRGFLTLLERMGAGIERRGEGVRVRGMGRLGALRVDMGPMPDQVPTLAALAPFARGVTEIRGASHLRFKESDRLHAMATELRRVGATVVETQDGLEIPGVWHSAEPPTAPVLVEVHDDHRIAMSMALVGLRRPGIQIATASVVTKSYPDFWGDLGRLLAP